jgi:diaminohydroxyphosphoribosylaminopyrimidine deaminase/5-amino-6-(5-phosphoribosylamino)uracil reductase
VIFDTRLRTPPSARVLSTLDAGPVIIMSTAPAVADAPARARALADAGARVEAVAPESRLRSGLERLAALGVTSLIVEGGPTLHASIWSDRLVDRIQMYVAPRVLGPAGLEWVSAPLLGSGYMVETSARPIGDDVLIEGYVHWPD